ncbi:MAG TPA: AAA family ATPase [Solirubrobacteraceae bacterium]|jgi:DNA-binding CsgD family transcriptional regulator|nr:AAA family ATPase [Solirubrobacteraceae bacterium]
MAEGTAADVIGRESEVGAVGAALEAVGSGRSLVLHGVPGIGKSTLWEAGLQEARARGLRVLQARASSAEAQLSAAALIDLCDGIERTVIAALAPRQRSALEVALLREEPGALPPDPQIVALGFLNALRAIAAAGPLVVAIDDAQWLDAFSAEALSFVARRLERESIGFLLSRRGEEAASLERAFPRGSLESLEIGPLSFGATRRLLAERFSLNMSRAVLRRIADVTLGNPLFIVELARELVRRGIPEGAEDIPMPSGIEEMLGTRVAALSPAVRRLLVTVALSGELHTGELAAIESGEAIDEAIDAGALILTGDRVRASHPLLAEAARSSAAPAEQRRLHRAVAETVSDETLRAKHRALAATQPNEALAASVAQAASAAAARGARQPAVELAEHALRLTPSTSPERPERLLVMAEYLGEIGELQRMTDLLTPELAALPPGAPRARAWLILSEGAGARTMADMARYRDHALAECDDDADMRATVLAKKAANAAAGRVADLAQAHEWAVQAIEAAQAATPDAQRLALYAMAWTRALRGLSVDAQCEAYRAASDAPTYGAGSPERVAAQRMVWRGEIERARVALAAMLALADERGERQSYALLRLHMCELHLRAGEWEAADALLEEWADTSDRDIMFRPQYERCCALLSAGRGDPVEAHEHGSHALARSNETGVRWDGLEAQRALALAATLAHDPAAAVEMLRDAWAHTQAEGVEDPGTFPVAPDLVEVLLELGEGKEAAAVAARLRELADAHSHPWGLAAAGRSEALIALSATDFDAAAAGRLRACATTQRELGLRFEAARTLLALGRAARRFKQWGLARAALEEAAMAFDEIGSSGWAEQTRSQLTRVGARRPRPEGELTDSEERAALLAAEGRTNKEIARELVVTVHTVEVHLSRAYAKLGITSRGQLAARLAAAAATD